MQEKLNNLVDVVKANPVKSIGIVVGVVITAGVVIALVNNVHYVDSNVDPGIVETIVEGTASVIA